jgi:predicted phosphodiesterase
MMVKFMRIAILSDIHGNQTALDAVLQDLAQQKAVDQIVIAGDICLNGPHPREVLETVRSLNCPVIQGNVDVEMVSGTFKKGGKKRDVIAWTREQVGEEGLGYLASLPFSYRVANPEGSDALVVHANPRDLQQAIFPTSSDDMLESLLGGVGPDIGAVAFGHLHIPYVRRWRHLLLFDVGSCGLSRDQDVRASYGILTWGNQEWEAEVRRVEYDVNAVVQQLEASGIPHVQKRIKILTEARY